MTQYILAPEALQDLHAVLDAVAVHVEQAQRRDRRSKHPFLVETGAFERGLVRPLDSVLLAARPASPIVAVALPPRGAVGTLDDAWTTFAQVGREASFPHVAGDVRQVDVIVDGDQLIIHAHHLPIDRNGPIRRPFVSSE